MVTSLPPVRGYELRPGEDGYVAIADLWDRLARPFDAARSIAALTGLALPDAGELVGSSIATSPEAERLLAEFSKTIRSLATALGTQAERCVGELRGTVLWSETLSARASSFGDPDLFVCATPSRAYDIDQNRVLVAALLAVRDAARDAVEHHGGDTEADDESLRAAVRNGNTAARFAEHPSLRGVSRGRVSARSLKRTRTSKKRTSYEPALAVLTRAAEPVSTAELLALCDERTHAQHDVLVRVVGALERLGGPLPAFRAEGGRLCAGPIQYEHPRAQPGGLGRSGILVGDVLVDVPADVSNVRDDEWEALERRAGGTVFLVNSLEDVDAAVARSIERARR